MSNHDEIELAFIREFSVLGQQLGRQVSTLQRQERIRLAIWREGRQNLPLADSGLTYAEAYRLWSGKNLEQRAKPRPPPVCEDDDAESSDTEIDAD